jgi:NTE family protein
VRAALRPWSVRPGTLAAALLPAGRVPTELVAAGFRPLFDAWPDDPLWINAVELDTGRRITFGRDPRPATVADAVAASCAIPSFFAPVVIDGVRYVDGGVHSPTNADLVAGLALDLVVVSSPMSIASGAPRLAPDQPARRWARVLLAREVARVRRSGTPVLTFQPTGPDLDVMGLNAMAEGRRAPVATGAFESARLRIASSRAAARIATLRDSEAARPA